MSFGKKDTEQLACAMAKGIGNFCHASSPLARVIMAKIFQPVVLNL